nr:PREDICTED: kinesin-like protein KIF2C [Struthio camelus australis]
MAARGTSSTRHRYLMEFLEIGGLIHNATIKTVNVERCSVSVEWSEGGAVKGKEIEIDDVITINPELAEEIPAADVKENLPLQENITVQKQKRRTTLSKIPAPREGEKIFFPLL